MMKILGIETSCDETAAALLEFKAGSFRILSNIISSSVKLQARYGGIVPEVAARKQMEMIMPVIEQALSGKKPDYIAVTNGPGLITSLRVGVEAAKSLSYIWNKPIITVNHLEGHIYSAQLNKIQDTRYKIQINSKFQIPIRFPALALIVSGGHTQLVLMKDYLKYKIIGETRDDSVGEAFDKVAKILGLGYPGGPIISKLAEKGDSEKIKMPRPMMNSLDYDFSFSGIKTSVLYLTKELGKSRVNKNKKNICASFQTACTDVLVSKTIKAAREHKVKTIILGGGVSANVDLRNQLKQKAPCALLIPEIKWTGDNAAMIALAGYYKIKAGKRNLSSVAIGEADNWRKIKTDPNLRLD